MKFLVSRIFLLTVLLQLAGLYYFGLGNWANVIQFVSGFGMAYGFWLFFEKHTKEIGRLHEKFDQFEKLLKTDTEETAKEDPHA